MKRKLLTALLVFVAGMWGLKAQTCQHSVELSDSYGDGWNGNTLTILVNGTAELTDITLASGYGPEIFYFNAAIGDDIDAIYTNNGSYPYETSYIVRDGGGVTLGQSGQGGTVPEDVLDMVGNCYACANPTGQVTSNITLSGADMSWTDAVGSAWDIYIVAAGSPAPDATTNPTVDNHGSTSYTWAGGASSTAYDWYVRTDCGGDVSIWTGPETFTTICESNTTFPMTEDFEGAFLPTCWSKIVTTGNDITQNIDQNHTTAGTYSARFSSYSNSADYNQYLFTQQQTITAPYTQLSFWHRKYADYAEVLEWGIATTTNPADFTWTPVTLSSTEWQETTVNLSAYVGQDVYIGFHYYGDYLYYVYLDDVSVEEAPTTPIVSITPSGSDDFGEYALNNLTTGFFTHTYTVENVGGGTLNVTGTSLTGGDAADFILADANAYPVGLTSGQSLTFDVTFSPSALGAKTTTLRIVADGDNDVTLTGSAYVAAPENLTGVANGSAIDLAWQIPLPEGEIRYDDGSVETSYWVGDPTTTSQMFYTKFNAAITGNLNYVAVLNRTNTLGQNWNAIMVCPDDGTGKPDLASPYATYPTPVVNSTTGEWNILELPAPVAMVQDEVFYVVTQWPDGNTDGPFVGTDIDHDNGRCAYTTDGGSTWNAFGVQWIMRAYMSVSKAPMHLVAGNEMAENNNLPVYALKPHKSKLNAENINIAQHVSVPVPGIYTTDMGSSKAFVDYTVHRGDATGVYNTTYTGISGTSYSDVTVAPATTYFYVVTAEYTDGTSDYSNEVEVTSLAGGCPAPTALVSSNITTSGADLSWTDATGTAWDIYIVAAGSPAPDGATTPTVDDHGSTSYTWSDGMASTAYDWYVRGDCGGGDISAWVGASFTTLTPAPSNDDCANAVALTVGDATSWIVGTNVGATDSNNNPDPIPAPGCASYLGGDVWYSATVPASGYMVMSTQTVSGSPLTDGGMAYYTGTCGTLTLGDCSDDVNGLMPELVINDMALAGQMVYVRFWEYGNNAFGDFEITAYTYPTATVWTGTTDTDWFDASNWNPGVPGSTTDVTIPAGAPNYPDITTAAECNNLVMGSDATGDASLMGQSNLTVNGTTTVQRYFTDDNWHGLSAPVSGAIANDLYLGGSPEVWAKYYDEAANEYVYVTDLNTPLGDMKGWMVWVGASTPQTFEIHGNLRSGLVGPVALTNSGPGQGDGYNLVGNPFPSTIDWDAASGWFLNNVDGGIWVWNPDGAGGPNFAGYVGGIGYNDGSRYIASGQAFFVQVTSTESSGSIGMNDEVQVPNAVNFMKSQSAISDYVKLKITDGDRYDESIVRFHTQATEGYDSQLDMHKYFSLDETMPQIYSTANNYMSVNALPFGIPSASVDVRGVDGHEFTIELEEVENFAEVYLTDEYLGITTNLMEQPYRFTYEAAQTDRFTVFFSVVGTQENQLDNVQVYSFDKKVRVIIPTQMQAHVEVVNMLGQTVRELDAHMGTQEIDLDHSGYYVVSITDKNQTLTRKVFIK